MQKIKNGKLYDTDTATCIATTEAEKCDAYYAEQFYQKTNGEFFLLIINANRNYGDTRYDVRPLDYELAMEWGELFMSRSEYESVFGPVYE